MILPLSHDLVLRVRGLMATAEMDFREASVKLSAEQSALEGLLDALYCTLKSIEVVGANYHMTIADVVRLYANAGLAPNVRALLRSTVDG
jgi:hypothetical protein